MAKPLSIQKSISGLLTLILTFGVTAPGVFLTNIPKASAATYTVSNLNDAGAGSLRQAITDANGSAGADTISFGVSGTINLASDLPGMNEATILDATSVTQAGPNIVLNAAGRNVGLMFNGGSGNAVKGIAVTGAQNCFGINVGVTGINVGEATNEGGVEANNCSSRAVDVAGASNVIIANASFGTSGANGEGININNNASNVTIGGTTAAERVYISGNTNNGINMQNVNNIFIKGNYIGVDKNGNTQANGQRGILVGTGCTNVTIGGTTAGERNIISGNSQGGISLNSNSVNVWGNYIGTDPTGLLARANGGDSGVRIESASNSIGGTTSDKRNVISGNNGNGIRIDASIRNANSNTIAFNYIGIKADGSAALANAQAGIQITGGSITGTLIGGANQGNVISGNTQGGIAIIGVGHTGTQILGNFIGTNPTGTASIGNGQDGISTEAQNTTIGSTNSSGRNIISSNGGHGVRLRSSNNTVIGNYIGSDVNGGNVGVTPNTNNGVKIENAGASNSIGGTNAGEANFIIVANTKAGVGIDNTGGNFNKIRQNSYAGAGTPVIVTAPSNQSIVAPTLTSATRMSPTTVQVVGTTIANGTVDLMVDGTWNSTTTSDGTGAINYTMTASSGAKVTATVTNGTNSTSGSAANVSIVNDTTAPSNPSLSYASEGTAGGTVTITGSGSEYPADVKVNGVTVTTLAVDGTFSYTATLVEGVNTFTFTVVDAMSNSSASNTATITGVAAVVSGGGSGTSISAGASGGGSSSHTTTTTTEDPIDTSNIDTTTESMAGDTEVVDPIATTEEFTTENTPSEVNQTEQTQNNTVSEPTNTSNSNTTTSENTQTPSKTNTVKTKPQNFYSGIYQYVEPIKPVSIRDTMPANPARPVAFDSKLLNAPLFGGKTIGGVPTKLLEIKLGSPLADVTKDSDNDGLLDGEEVLNNSDPFNKDGDGDGVNDFQEIEFEGTDPSSWDSDQDFIPDSKDEQPLLHDDIRNNIGAKELTDYIAENKISEDVGITDSDADGLCDEVELYMGTDPQEADSDADGLKDGDEVLTYGTDPSNPTATGTGGVLRLANTSDEETVAEGEQFYMGSADAGSTVGIYEISGGGVLSLLGQTEADEAGRFTVYTNEALNPGKHTLVAIQGTDASMEDVSKTFTVNVVNSIKRPEYVSLALKNGSNITDRQPTIDLEAGDNYIIVVSWRSTVYNQVLIADAANQIVYAQPSEELELGEHTVTWYAQDLSSNDKSTPTRVNFNITNEAFVGGQSASDNSPLTLIFGSLAVLSSLAALGLYFRKNKAGSTRL